MKRGIFVGTAVTLMTLMAPGTLTAFAATTTTSSSPVIAANSPASNATTYGATYTVVQGDTFYMISQKTSTSLPALVQTNPQIANFDLIYPGEVIYLPQKYVMQADDTLYKVAVAQNISLSTLEAANPQIVDYGNIQPGQVINLPKATLNTSEQTSTVSAGPTTTAASTTPVASTSTPASTAPAASTSTPASTAPAASTSTPASTAPAASTSANSALRQNIVNYAESFMGVPYVWGGSTPSTGFDCSGFVEYVFLHFGITLPRESHDQATVGTPVSQNDLQLGDLLFFKDTDSIASSYVNQVSHVGIYIGNGSMVESTSVNNKGITIIQNVFSKPYYVSHYYGARNIIGQ